jgi:hypothetical protein
VVVLCVDRVQVGTEIVIVSWIWYRELTFWSRIS